MRLVDHTRWEMHRGREKAERSLRGAPLGECHRIWTLTLLAAFVSRTWMKTE